MIALTLLLGVAQADETFVLEGTVDAGGLDHVFVPFDVPEGVGEIEVVLDDGDPLTILDWGIDDPAGHRGWGGGKSEPAVINAVAASGSYAAGPLQAGTWNVVVGKAKLAGLTASYAITVTLRDEPTLSADPDRGPYAPSPALETGARWYLGDLHVHSVTSGDARAELDDIADLARAEGLDFVVLTEHNVALGADFLVAAQARHPDVLFVPGIEVTTYDGHAGAIGAVEWVDHRLGQPRAGGVVDAQSMVDDVLAQGAVFSVHHPTLDLGDLCIGCAWDLDVPEGVGGVEIGNGGWSPTGSLFTLSAIAFWDDLCAEGRRIAALGGSDDHRAGVDLGPFDTPVGTSRTAVWAEELSVRALLDGIRAQKTQVLLDGAGSPVLELHADGVLVDGTWAAKDPRVSVPVLPQEGELHWVVDGEDVGPGVEVGGDWVLDVEADDAPVRVRAEWWVDDHPTTVTSHVWLVREDPRETLETATDDGGGEGPGDRGCGCAFAPHVGGMWVGLLSLGLTLRRRVR